MATLVEFETSKFDFANEPENEFNQIHGQSILLWIMGCCASVSFVGLPEAEDWGWYIDAQWNERRYMIGASAVLDDSNSVGCIVQVEKERTIKEKLLGKEKLAKNDEVVRQITNLFLNDSDFQNVECRFEGDWSK